METGKNINIRLQPIALGVFALAVAAIAGLALVLFTPEDGGGAFRRGELFWWHLVWFELIFTFLWFDGFFMPSSHLQKNRRFVGAGYLAASSRVVATVTVSLAIFSVSVFLPDSGMLKMLSIFAQIFVLIAFGVSMVMIMGSQQLQLDGLESLPPELPTPGELAQELEFCAEIPGLTPTDLERLRRLKERMRYSLSGTGKISRSAAYPVLVTMIDSLIREIRNGGVNALEPALRQVDNQISRVLASCRSESR